MKFQNKKKLHWLIHSQLSCAPGKRNTFIRSLSLVSFKNRNYLASQIPGTLGYIDGTHVAIKAPRQEEHVYLNRKHYHSLNVMILSYTKVKTNCKN